MSHGSTKGSSSQGGKAQDILDRSSSIRDEASKGNFNGVKELVTKGQTSKDSTTQGDVGGASSSTGVNKENVDKQSLQETGKQISTGGIAQDNTEEPSTVESNTEQRNVHGDKQHISNSQSNTDTQIQHNDAEEKQTEEMPKKLESKERDRKSSVAAGILEPNYDIRKGPITIPGTFQEKNFHNKDGKETIMQRGVNSKAISPEGTTDGKKDAGANASEANTEQNDFSKGTPVAGSASKNAKTSSKQEGSGTAISGGNYSDSFINKELKEQANISPDVFKDKTDGEGISKKSAGQDASGKYHLDKTHLDRQGSQTTQKAGEGAAAAAAITGGYAASKGGKQKSSTIRNPTTKSTSTSQTNAARAHDLDSTSPKSGIAAIAGGANGTRGQGLSKTYNSYAHAAGGPGSSYGATTTGLNASNQTGLVGGIQPAGASGATGRGELDNRMVGIAGTEDSSTRSTVVNGVNTKRTVRQLSSSGYKLTVLQEKVQAVSQKCKTQLGLSSSEISKRSTNVDAFFDAVAIERLRWMPRDGSRLDCSLRWASRLAYAVDALRESVGAFAPAANEAAMLIWGFAIFLLEVS